MKKLNITKEQFEKSQYFKNKYGRLEYVSESGKLFKTDKNNVLKFTESYDDDDDDEDEEKYTGDVVYFLVLSEDDDWGWEDNITGVPPQGHSAGDYATGKYIGQGEIAAFKDEDEAIEAAHSEGMAREAIEERYNYILVVKEQYPTPESDVAKVLEVVDIADTEDMRGRLNRRKLLNLMKNIRKVLDDDDAVDDYYYDEENLRISDVDFGDGYTVDINFDDGR